MAGTNGLQNRICAPTCHQCLVPAKVRDKFARFKCSPESHTHNHSSCRCDWATGPRNPGRICLTSIAKPRVARGVVFKFQKPHHSARPLFFSMLSGLAKGLWPAAPSMLQLCYRHATGSEGLWQARLHAGALHHRPHSWRVHFGVWLLSLALWEAWEQLSRAASTKPSGT